MPAKMKLSKIDDWEKQFFATTFIFLLLFCAFIPLHIIWENPINLPRLARIIFSVIFLAFCLLSKRHVDLKFYFFSMILLALCAFDLLINLSVSARLYDFVFVFLSFYIIFERGYSLNKLFLIFLFWFVVLYLDASLTILFEIFRPIDTMFMDFSFMGSFSNNTKTVFIVTSTFSLLAFLLIGPLSLLLVVPLGLTVLVSTTERALIFGFLVQIFFFFLGLVEVKKRYSKLFLTISSFVVCVVVLWAVFAPTPNFAVHPFFDSLAVRLVLFIKALFVIAENFPRGLGENGCASVLGSIDLTSYLQATTQKLEFDEGQKQMLLFYASPIFDANRSTHNVMLLLLCDHGVVGLSFIVFMLFVMISTFGFFLENYSKSVSFSLLGFFVSVLIAYSLTSGGNEIHFLAMICGLFGGLQRHKKIINVNKL